jgi:hypothetical protein
MSEVLTSACRTAQGGVVLLTPERARAVGGRMF